MLTALGTIAALSVGAPPAQGFGSTELLGQNSEHQHITESLGVADPRWDPNSLKLVAGSKGNYGAVASPDRMTDSSATPLNGLGPGYKHCDDGDWLDTAGYPFPKDAARAELERCARYYQYLLNRAVRYAGQLVTPDLKVNEAVFTMTENKKNFSPDSACRFRFSLTADANPKCDVLNAFGRSLHLAEDVWSHTNWGDEADPNRAIGITNPPGLGNTISPSFLRYPADATIPDGLISGCDDSVPGSTRCKGRVAHSALAKDNGTFDADGTNAKATDKYNRGLVVVDGVSNFQRAITGARMQVASTWTDLQDAILAKYGEKRGEAIIAVLRSDSKASVAPVEVTVTDEPLVRAAAVPDGGEFAADPSQDAELGEGDKASDPGHAALHDHGADEGEAEDASGDTMDESSQEPADEVGAEGEPEREAAGSVLGETPEGSTAVAAQSSGDDSVIWSLLLGVLGGAAAAMVVIAVNRRRRST